jgi:hypothetical protein
MPPLAVQLLAGLGMLASLVLASCGGAVQLPWTQLPPWQSMPQALQLCGSVASVVHT